MKLFFSGSRPWRRRRRCLRSLLLISLTELSGSQAHSQCFQMFREMDWEQGRQGKSNMKAVLTNIRLFSSLSYCFTKFP